MGLDMYLKCNDRELVQEVNKEVFEARNGIIMYWRKANAIHNWIVNNLSDAESYENCDTISLDYSDLEALKSTCDKVLANPELAPRLLPTTDGFFFGSQEYDEWYFDDVEYTSKTIGKILSLLRTYNGQAEKGVSYRFERYYSHRDWPVRFDYHAWW